MTRGVLSGFLTGGVVSTAAVAVVSVLVGAPKAPDVTTAAPVAQSEAPSAVAETGAQVATSQDTDPTQPETPAVEAPAPDADPDVAEAAETPVTPPVVSTQTNTLPDPVEPAAQGEIAVNELEPVYPNPQARAPQVPNVDTAAISGTAPADAPNSPSPVAVQPDLDSTETPVAPEAAESVQPVAPQVDTASNIEPTAPAAPNQPAKTDAPEVETTPAAPIEVAEAEVPAETPATPEPETAEVETAEAEPETDTEATAPSEDSASEADETTTTAMLVPTERVSIGRPATSLLDRGDEDTSDQLPGVQPVSTEPASETPAETATASSEGETGSALSRHAVPFDNPDRRPLMSIVLMDTGEDLSEGAVGLEALQSFPYKLSFAVNASLPDAADRAAIYRAQGFEVLALVDLPGNLTAADTEIAMTAALEAVPEAVAVMEGTGDGLQGSKDMSDQISEILLDSGHGIVWQPKGLDTAQKLAARDGVASQTLFRDFDDNAQSARTIRRFLDQAAFKAGQSGSVIMVGRVRPDTISALLVWGLQDRAARVAVAPVSAVLSSQPVTQ